MFFFSSRRRHTRFDCDWSSDVCSSDLCCIRSPPAAAGKMIEYSNEARFQLDLKVADAALAAYLPAGWMPNVAPQGAAKDCNLRAIFIDRVTINGPDGKPLGKGSSRVVWLAAPVKEPGGANVQLIIGGLTDEPSDVPGP